jgi:hypothetical protein
MCMVVTGLAVVGVTDFLFSDNANTSDTYGIIAGDLLIITAQIITGFEGPFNYCQKFATFCKRTFFSLNTKQVRW